MRNRIKVCLISLGCPKNLVDSEVMTGRMAGEGIEIVYDPEGADAAVVNTCGFIRPAIEESLGTIEELLHLKEEGSLGVVVVAGCLVQRFRRELAAELSAVDAFLPISDYAALPRIIRSKLSGSPSPGGRKGSALVRGGGSRQAETDLCRVPLTPSHTAYLRIAEGCNHRCSFCAIPSIRGRLRSKPISVLREETRRLADLGVKEINLVAEDTTDYGRDLRSRGGKGDESGLPELLDALSRVRGIRWIRILYAFPSRVTDRLIETIRDNPKVLEYLDVPVQHYNGRILKSMRRGTPPAFLDRLVHRLREGVPGIVLRTSVIVGYPGENRAAFDELFGFVKRSRFERLGAFAYSPEEGTRAAALGAGPAARTVNRRLERLMEFQRSVIEERNKALVGGEGEVIVDAAEDRTGYGRTRGDAPDIDCGVSIRGRRVEPGLIIKVRFTGQDGYDLIARPLAEIR